MRYNQWLMSQKSYVSVLSKLIQAHLEKQRRMVKSFFAWGNISITQRKETIPKASTATCAIKISAGSPLGTQGFIPFGLLSTGM